MYLSDDEDDDNANQTGDTDIQRDDNGNQDDDDDDVVEVHVDPKLRNELGLENENAAAKKAEEANRTKEAAKAREFKEAQKAIRELHSAIKNKATHPGYYFDSKGRPVPTNEFYAMAMHQGGIYETRAAINSYDKYKKFKINNPGPILELDAEAEEAEKHREDGKGAIYETTTVSPHHPTKQGFPFSQTKVAEKLSKLSKLNKHKQRSQESASNSRKNKRPSTNQENTWRHYFNEKGEIMNEMLDGEPGELMLVKKSLRSESESKNVTPRQTPVKTAHLESTKSQRCRAGTPASKTLATPSTPTTSKHVLSSATAPSTRDYRQSQTKRPAILPSPQGKLTVEMKRKIAT